MSNANSDNQAGSASTKAIQLRAAEWIMERREVGNWSDEQQKSLDVWLAETPSHLLAYWRLNAAWERTHRLAALYRRGGEQAKESKTRYSFRPSLLRIVAVCAVAGFIGFTALHFYLEPTETTYATAVGGHKIITLADGSRVELNTDTVLHATIGQERKDIELERGEAYFEVRHDIRRPFVVQALGHRVTDLGTKFLVREDAGWLRVALVEGRANFESADPQIQQHSVIMNPGDVVVATAGTMSVTKLSSKALTSELAWRSRILIFDDTPLVDAVTEFNRYNREKLDVPNPQIASLKIDGTFRIDNTRGFLDMARHVLGLQVVQRGEKIVISR